MNREFRKAGKCVTGRRWRRGYTKEGASDRLCNRWPFKLGLARNLLLSSGLHDWPSGPLHDVAARRALARFCAVLGSVAGDAALIHGRRDCNAQGAGEMRSRVAGRFRAQRDLSVFGRPTSKVQVGKRNVEH